MEHHFTGPPFTVGVEEELMIVDSRSMELVSAIEEMIDSVPHETEGEVKPELLQSVLEISTDVCRSVAEAGGQLEELRRRVRETAESKDLTIGSAATHPFARWEDQQVTDGHVHASVAGEAEINHGAIETTAEDGRVHHAGP